MAAFRYPRVSASEITPRSVWLDRRRFIVRRWCCSRSIADRRPCVPCRAACRHPRSLSDRRGTDLHRGRDELQQFLRVRHRQERTRKNNSGDFNPEPWTLEVGRHGQPAANLRSRRPARLSAGGANLSHALRGRLVDGHSLGGLPPGRHFSTRSSRWGSAKFVHFETVVRPEEMPGQRG